MDSLMWLFSFVFLSGGALVFFLAPSGLNALAWVGGCSGALGCVFLLMAVYRGLNRVGRSNMAKNFIAIVSLVSAMAGFNVSLAYGTGWSESPYSRLYTVLGYFGMASGIVGALYAFRYHMNAGLIAIVSEIGGFEPADSGFTRPDGRYDIKGVMNGVRILMDGTDYPAHGKFPHSIALDIVCETLNPLNAHVVAYPEGKMPVQALPKDIGHIPYWDWYTVRSEPVDAAEKYLSASRMDASTVFKDEYGFYSLELKGCKLICRFKGNGRFDKVFVREILEQVSKLAASIK